MERLAGGRLALRFAGEARSQPDIGITDIGPSSATRGLLAIDGVTDLSAQHPICLAEPEGLLGLPARLSLRRPARLPPLPGGVRPEPLSGEHRETRAKASGPTHESLRVMLQIQAKGALFKSLERRFVVRFNRRE
jgi:hypothetical protein